MRRQRKNPAVCLTHRGVRICWLRSLSLIRRNASAALVIQNGVPSQSLGHSASLATTSPPLSHGETHNGGQSRCASTRFNLAADGGAPKPEREVSRSVDRARSKVSKCFGSPPVREANHIANHSQSSCRNDSLPNHHARRTGEANRKQLGTNVTESRPGKDFEPMVRHPSESTNERRSQRQGEPPPRRRAKPE